MKPPRGRFLPSLAWLSRSEADAEPHPEDHQEHENNEDPHHDAGGKGEIWRVGFGHTFLGEHLSCQTSRLHNVVPHRVAHQLGEVELVQV